jgi:formate dehydrogenase subunit delta
MSIEHLVTMANQIGDFFKAEPDETQAQKDIAMHLKRFWARQMRNELVTHINQTRGEGLQLIVINAIQKDSTFLS